MCKTILVVDYNRIDLKLMPGALGKKGYTILTAENDGKAIRKAKEGNPDIVILDVLMSSEDLLDLYIALANSCNKKNVKFILLAHKNEVKNLCSELRYNADLFVTKPFNIQKLVEIVSEFNNQGLNSAE